MSRINQSPNRSGFCKLIYICFVVIGLSIIFYFLQDVRANSGRKYPSSPVRVVQELCELDAQGKRLRGEIWQQYIAPLVTWQEEAGDMIFIVSDYKIGKAKILDSRAKVPVEYSCLGSTDFISFSMAEKQTKTITYELIKQKGAWKIERPITAPHVLWKETITFLRALQKDEPQRKKQLDNIIQKIEKAAKQAKST